MWYPQCATLPMGKKKVVQTTAPYKIHLQLGTDVYESEGVSMLDALRNLKKPDKIMAKAILTVTHDGKRAQQMFFPQRLKRLFFPAFQHIHAKILEKSGLKPIHDPA